MAGLPTFYDSFYNNLQIALIITEITKIKKEFKEIEIPFNTTYLGYAYFVEIVIINLLLNLEGLIEDEHLRDRIKWGDNTLEDQDVKKILSNHSEGKYILELNSIRRDLSKIRNNDPFDEKKLDDSITQLREKLLVIDKQIQQNFSVKRINNNPNLERRLILFDVIANYNYIHHDVDFNSESTIGEPLYPGNLTFYLMPKQQRQNYILCNDRLVSKKSEYLQGYRTCLEYLYSTIMPSKKKYFKKIFSGVNDWLELHNTYDTILSGLHLEKMKNRQIFDMTFKSVKKTINKDTIENYDELTEVLRNRRTRFFENFDLDESILDHYFFGAIDKIERGAKGKNKTKLEIIQLFVRENDFSQLVYYALFNPLPGMFSDGSHWLIFKDNGDYRSIIGRVIKKYSESRSDIIDYHRYSTPDENLIEKYKSEHTYGIKKEIQKNEDLKSSRGLLSEFISLFYLIKQNRNEQIINIDFHKEIPGTDIDVLLETQNRMIIGQVKPYLSFDPEELKSILTNFNLIEKHLKDVKKPFLKQLFLMANDSPTSEIQFIIEDLPKNNEIIPLDGYIENTEEKIQAELTKNGIGIMYLGEILEKLETDGNYSGLINQMKMIFIKQEFDPFDKESFLWQ
jgi:hypothetical protein